MSVPHIRTLHPDDVLAVRALRQRALREEPDAFISDIDDELALTDDAWRKRLAVSENNVVVGGFLGEALVAMVGAQRDPRLKLRHEFKIVAMYVAPEARRAGLGAAIVRAILDNVSAHPEVRCAKLGVIAGNTTARSLYERVGFTQFAVTPYAMRLADGTLASSHEMIFEFGAAKVAP